MKSTSVTRPKAPMTALVTPLKIEKPKPWKPHPYQKAAVKFLLERSGAGLLLDPGLGKTSITLAALSLLKRTQKAGPTLIIAPLRVCYQVWPAEIRKWADFKDLRIEILHGPKKEEALARPADIYIINPEGLDWLLDVVKFRMKNGKFKVTTNLRRLKQAGIERLVVDELSKFKHIQSLRFKAIKQALGMFKQRWGLTGSPAANGMEDLFGECFILDRGVALGEYITHFRFKYFHATDKNGYVLELNHGAEEQIFERLRPLMLRMSADDYLQLPPQVETKIWVDLPMNVRILYDQMENDMLAKLGTKLMVAGTAASASMTCRQVLSGAVYEKSLIDEGDPFGVLAKRRRVGVADAWVGIHDEKLAAIKDLVEELQGKPLLVIYEFRHDLERLLKLFGKETPYIGGGISPAKSAKIEKDWNDGKIPVLLGHPASMGHGLNLQSGGHIAFFSLTWDFELFDQVIRRLRRQGTKHAQIFVYYLMVKDSIDESILEALQSKEKTQNTLFAALSNRKKCVRQASVGIQ